MVFQVGTVTCVAEEDHQQDIVEVAVISQRLPI